MRDLVKRIANLEQLAVKLAPASGIDRVFDTPAKRAAAEKAAKDLLERVRQIAREHAGPPRSTDDASSRLIARLVNKSVAVGRYAPYMTIFHGAIDVAIEIQNDVNAGTIRESDGREIERQFGERLIAHCERHGFRRDDVVDVCSAAN